MGVEKPGWLENVKILLLYGGGPLLIFAAIMLAPKSACERITHNRWEFVRAVIHEEKTLFVEAYSPSRGRSGAFTKLVSLDLNTGLRKAEFVRGSGLKFLGRGEAQLCYHDYAPGLFGSSDFSVGLPGLEPMDTSQDCSFPDPKNLSCEWHEAPPARVGEMLLLDALSLCDSRTGKAFPFSGDHRLISWQNLEGEPGKLRIGVLIADDRLAWAFEEESLYGHRERTAPGARLAWITAFGDDLLLAVQLGRNPPLGDLWLLRLDPTDGSLRWKHRIH